MTGRAAAGIGKACALTLAAKGVKVALADLNEDLGEEVAEEIRRAGGKSPFVATDVADLVAYLCSDQASFLTGGSYRADGGYTAP